MMNIVMVGHKGVGKTAFTAGLYHYCGNKSWGWKRRSFGINGISTGDISTLSRLSETLSRGRYPEATDTLWNSYDLKLTHRGKDILNFKWTDHKGGLLTDNTGGTDKQKSFLKIVENADALIVFLDGERLTQTNDIGQQYLMTCMYQALSSTHNRSYPVCFVVTKWDIVKRRDLPGLKYWQNVFDIVRNRDDLKGMLTKSGIPKDGCKAPFHCMIFCIAYGIDIYIDQSIERQKEAYKRQLSYEASNIGEAIGNAFQHFGRGVERLFGGTPPPSRWELAGEERDKQAAEVAEQEKLKKYRKRLQKMVAVWKEEF